MRYFLPLANPYLFALNKPAMRSIITAFIVVFLQLAAFSQTIEGNRLLDLVDKQVSDPLFQDLKRQEKFYTDAWDEDFTIYISREGNMITEVEFENGKLRYGSKTERYGYYTKTLPMQLTWGMSPADFAGKFGAPHIESTNMGFKDYKNNGWYIRVFFEESKPVSISFKKIAGTTPSIPATTPVKTTPAPVAAPSNIKSGWLIDLKSENKVEMNWPVFESMINNFNNLKVFAGNDSVDYIGQVYYNSNIKLPGFERVALMRTKKSNRWHMEAFVRINGDSVKAKRTFFAIYDAIKNSIDANAKSDFIFVAEAKDPVSKSPMNWLAQWSLYTNYKKFVPGLNKMRFNFFMSGMKNAFKNDQMEYTIKIYLSDPTVEIDFFTWDKPRN